ncbi:MAG: mechanosensitive ion channel domain-containing protein [Pseudomonadota bacterium]
MNWETLLPQIQTYGTMLGINIITAALIFVIGKWAARIVKKVIVKLMNRAKVDTTLTSFVANLAYVGLMAFVVITSLSRLGIQTASLVAVLAAAGLAVGLALQGSLSNFAAGVLMIIFRPFKVGDRIDAAGIAGVVEEIDIFTTRLRTPDNKAIVVPNGQITGGPIVNYSAKDSMRVDMVFGVSYGDDIDKVKSVIADELSKHPKILPDPPPMIKLLELADSSVNFAVRPWVKTPDYWDVYFDTMENMKKRFDAEGISIPFPQRDVYMYGVDEEECEDHEHGEH